MAAIPALSFACDRAGPFRTAGILGDRKFARRATCGDTMDSESESATPSDLIDAIDDLVVFVETHDDRKRRDSGLTPDLQSELLRKDARVFSLAKRLGLPIPEVELSRSTPGNLAKPQRCGYTGVSVVGGLRGNIMIIATATWKSKLVSLRHAAETLVGPPATFHSETSESLRQESKTQRPAFRRDHYFLRRRKDGAKPSEIRSQWNAMSDKERHGICPKLSRRISEGRKGTETVENAIKVATSEERNR
jgi:hypothetical protein